MPGIQLGSFTGLHVPGLLIPVIQFRASAESAIILLVLILWSCVQTAETTHVKPLSAKCLLFSFIIIIVFASSNIAMIASFLLKLSIKY